MRIQVEDTRTRTRPRRSIARSLAFALALPPLAIAGSSPAQTAPAELDYGPHGVGFRVIEALDSTRAFRPLRDFRGRLAAETARPVQLSVWYPARPPAGSAPMTAGDFRLLVEREVDFDATLTRADADRLRSEFIATAEGFGRDPAEAAGAWDEPTRAVRDASPIPGPHPVVLYLTAAGVNNPGLGAYLASHGFVVASFPSNGRMTEGTLEFTPNALTLDTDIDDAGFVHALLRRIPWADTRRLAVASFSSGSLAALLWTMRDMQPAAIVAIEGWERYRRGADIVTASVHYDPDRVRVPFLMLERAADEASPRYAKVPDVVGAMPYADITRVAFRDAAHSDFLSHVTFGHTPHQPAIYGSSVSTIRLFLEAHLMADDDAARGLADLAAPADDAFFTITRHPAMGVVPTEEELYRLAETDPTTAAATYRSAVDRLAGGRVAGERLFREAVLTRAAIFAPSPEAAARIMAIVVDAYPGSTAARFRLGRALADSGQSREAAGAFEAALGLVDADPSLGDAERDDWHGRIGAAIEALDRSRR